MVAPQCHHCREASTFFRVHNSGKNGAVPAVADCPLKWIEDDLVVGVWQDEDDVKHVHGYDLIKP